MTVRRPNASQWSDRRLWVMLGLGFSSGLPWPLSGLTLRQWLTEGHISLAVIGATGTLGLSYSLKFLWSPLLDRGAPGPLARFGRRRGWLLLIQPALLVAMIGFAAGDPAHGIALLLAIAATIAFLSASQDIAIDAWRIETFVAARQPAALAAYTWGYRLALLLGGAGAMALASPLGWHGALLAVAMAGVVGLAATLAAPESPRATALQTARWRDFRDAYAGPVAEFMRRPGAIAALAYVILFKLGEAMAAVMLFPLYRHLGFQRPLIALAQGPIALTATLCGYLSGGWVIARIGLGRALVTTGFGQMAVMTMYIALAVSAGSHSMLFATSVTESFVEGVADAAFLTFLSALCAPAYTATQYALLSSAASLPLRTLGGAAGWLATQIGFTAFYAVASAASLPAMLVMVLIIRRWPGLAVRPSGGMSDRDTGSQLDHPVTGDAEELGGADRIAGHHQEQP